MLAIIVFIYNYLSPCIVLALVLITHVHLLAFYFVTFLPLCSFPLRSRSVTVVAVCRHSLHPSPESRANWYARVADVIFDRADPCRRRRRGLCAGNAHPKTRRRRCFWGIPSRPRVHLSRSRPPPARHSERYTRHGSRNDRTTKEKRKKKKEKPIAVYSTSLY